MKFSFCSGTSLLTYYILCVIDLCILYYIYYIEHHHELTLVTNRTFRLLNGPDFFSIGDSFKIKGAEAFIWSLKILDGFLFALFLSRLGRFTFSTLPASFTPKIDTFFTLPILFFCAAMTLNNFQCQQVN
jgi:hypothetical protein